MLKLICFIALWLIQRVIETSFLKRKVYKKLCDSVTVQFISAPLWFIYSSSQTERHSLHRRALEIKILFSLHTFFNENAY